MWWIQLKCNIYFVGTQTGTECCGSIIDFENNTSPTGAFQRITAGPAFYVAKGKQDYFLNMLGL